MSVASIAGAVTAYVGLGGNLGDAERTLQAAFVALDAIPRTRCLRASRLYRTAAWGREDQPAFVNAAAELETTLDARALLEALLGIERAFGRDRAGDSGRWGPRTLDLDLLLYGAQVIDEPGLRVPHPHLHERAFVLVPLLEIAPAADIPRRGPARDALAAMASDGVQAIGWAMDAAADRRPVTVPDLAEAKRAGRRLVMLTAYDAGFARVLDANGIDLVLVGDSLGMVVQGHGSTLPVSVDDIAYHTTCVARGLSRALLVADLPFQSDATPERALDASMRFLQAGAGMVKLEGAGHKLDTIRFLVEREIPVCAHLGLTPQSVLRFGGYKVQGREEAAAKKLRDDAQAVADAGALLLVLECVPSSLAAAITAAIPIPTIGIGAGAGCDGQVLVLHDLLGLDSGHRRPKFVKDFLADGGSVAGAVRAFADAVRDGSFPDDEHAYV